MMQEFYGKDLAGYKLERAREELDTAELLFNNEKLKAANNRAYYSIYYSLTAVLCLQPRRYRNCTSDKYCKMGTSPHFL